MKTIALSIGIAISLIAVSSTAAVAEYYSYTHTLSQVVAFIVR
jgi:hypothetical protein